jgi:hypothetical protein
MKKTILVVTSCLLLASISLISCKKTNNAGSSKMTVYLTDDPASYDAVNIDIQDIQVNNSSDNGTDKGWVSIAPHRKGIYNLLDFKNGLDTLLGSDELPAGDISQIRLILGTNNSVTVNGINYPLSTPSAQQSGLKLNVHATLVEGIEYKIWLDFDAGRSIVITGNGSYILKPVIRTYTQATSGAIKGDILPLAARSIVYAIQNSTDTIGSAITDAVSGNFLIGGLPAGNYTVAIDASNNYADSAINTSVSTGIVTDLGPVHLHQ